DSIRAIGARCRPTGLIRNLRPPKAAAKSRRKSPKDDARLKRHCNVIEELATPHSSGPPPQVLAVDGARGADLRPMSREVTLRALLEACQASDTPLDKSPVAWQQPRTRRSRPVGDLWTATTDGRAAHEGRRAHRRSASGQPQSSEIR